MIKAPYIKPERKTTLDSELLQEPWRPRAQQPPKTLIQGAFEVRIGFWGPILLYLESGTPPKNSIGDDEGPL